MSVDHDRDIRPRLLALLATRAQWICEEFSADGKVDVAAVEGGRLCGYEIKAAKDTLKRLGLAGGAQVEGRSPRIFLAGQELLAPFCRVFARSFVFRLDCRRIR